MDIPVEKKFKILCEITRAQHFAWRQAVKEICPSVDPEDVVKKMWEITGHETAKAYMKKLDPQKPIPIQVAHSIVWSSQTMGEDAHVEEGSSRKEAFVRHDGCPWFDWHRRLNLLKEDQPGCDTWFETAVKDIAEKLGVNLRIETQKSLPEGGDACVRRIWIEE